jgi:DNA primase
MRLAGPGAAESPVEARRIVDRVRPVLLAVSDPVERGMYIQRVARHLGVGEEAVLERLRQSAVRARRPDANGQEAPAPEEYLLALLVRHPGLRSEFRHIPEHLFTRAVDREVFRRWLHEDRGDDENDPVTLQRRRVEALRLPLLSERQAA